MVWLKGRSISNFALVMILFICHSSSGNDNVKVHCYRCSGSGNECKIIDPNQIGTCGSDYKDAFCYVHAFYATVQRDCGHALNTKLSKHGKLCKCKVDKCNGFNVTKESDLNKCIKENSAVGQSDHYSNVVGLLISLCKFTLWFVITNVNSISGLERGPGLSKL